jgi:hypothetical protein
MGAKQDRKKPRKQFGSEIPERKIIMKKREFY